MIDYFALLQEPRRPHLDAERVKARFIERAAALHPDRSHQSTESEKTKSTEEFARLNNAQQCLQDTVSRLRHLLELETGAAPGNVRDFPPEMVDLFVEIAQNCRQTDAFLEEKRRTTSPLLKVRLFESGLEWGDKLRKLQEMVQQRQMALTERLAALNGAWESAPPPGDARRPPALPLRALDEAYRSASFLARANQQIQERIVQLAI